MFTLERHRQLGTELARLQLRIAALSQEIDRSYRKSRARRAAFDVGETVRDLRSALDDELAAESHAGAGELANVYYPVWLDVDGERVRADEFTGYGRR